MIKKETEEIIKKINISAYKLGTLQGFVSLLHDFRNAGITDAKVIEEVMMAKVTEVYWNVAGRDNQQRTQYPPINWGVCPDCHVPFIFRFADDITLIECPKCFYSKIATEADSGRHLTKEEKQIFLKEGSDNG